MVSVKGTSNKLFLNVRNFFAALNLIQAEESGRRRILTASASTESIPRQQWQPQDHQALELQHQIVVENNGCEIFPEDEPTPPDSKWVISIKEKLKQADQDNMACSWTKHSIYRIPHRLKDGEDKAHVPQIVSLGPYHNGKKRLCQMEQHKWRCLHRILRREKHKIALYLDSVKEVEEKARAFYEGTISMSSDEFVEMMVLDGCFMIELFRGAKVGFEDLGYPFDDPIFSTQGSMHSIRRDVIMLENQIPFFILEQLFCLQCRQPDQGGLLAELALLFLDPLKPTDSMEVVPLSDQARLHCLEVFRRSLLGSGPKPEPRVMTPWSEMRQQHIHCVSELRDAGIRFSKRNTDNFWDIQFNSGTLEIPRLVIDDRTRSLFLNLIAFEQCHFNCSDVITSYVIFMDNLINSSEDVGHLQDNGIIEHWLGSEAEVAKLFNRLCQEVVFDINDSYLSTLSARVKDYSSHKRHRWGFLLKHKHFGNPWSIISLIAAFVLLVLTFIQTFYGVYGYYIPGP
ncbi:UPF0481 protein At3g47200-like [Rhodamnia argentea]|uniref:UPF0481 protein At3g47200-like n=1 Tax=Rhodamnia argentea TaxID=178133 RepID=A0A8B8PDH2_9MYRT|nr:UPF0481 protein At3g47200-like [Rhodamnia argentea]